MPRYKFSDIAFNIINHRMPIPEDKELYVGLEHMDSGSLTISRWGSPVDIIGQKLIMTKGDILFGRRNTYLKRAAVAPHDGLFSAHGMIFRPKTNIICADLLPFFISSDYFMEKAIRISVGSISPTVNWGTLKDVEFNLPPLEEQVKLAGLLVAANDTKEAYKKLLEKTDELVKSQFIEMFGSIEESTRWPSKLWKEVLVIQNGRDYKGFAVDEGFYPVYGSGGEMARATQYLCPENTVVIGRKGTIDKPLLVNEKFWNIDTAFGIIAKPEYLHYMYLFWYCKQFDFLTLNKATTLPSLTKNDLLKIQINIPPIGLQEHFASFVKQVDKFKSELQQTMDKLNTTIKMLI